MGERFGVVVVWLATRIYGRTVLRRIWFDPLFVLVALAIYASDQFTKVSIVRAIGPEAERNSIEIVGNWARFTYATNTGAAFGLLPGQPWLFTIVAIIAIPALWYFNASIAPRTLLTRVCLGALLGGALGNLTDRIRLGYVVDFVDIGVGTWRWPAFNIADSAFVVGIFLLAVFVFLRGDEAVETVGESSTGKAHA